MATLEMLAANRADAVQRMTEAMQRISTALGVEPVEIKISPLSDPFTQQTQHLVALADYIQLLAAKIAPDNPLDSMSVPKLKDFAKEHRIDLGKATKKDDIRAIIESALAVETPETSLDDEPPADSPVTPDDESDGEKAPEDESDKA